MANVNGSHNQMQIRAGEDGRSRMVERVLLRCPNLKVTVASAVSHDRSSSTAELNITYSKPEPQWVCGLTCGHILRYDRGWDW